jgi:hypothetical protein
MVCLSLQVHRSSLVDYLGFINEARSESQNYMRWTIFFPAISRGDVIGWAEVELQPDTN